MLNLWCKKMEGEGEKKWRENEARVRFVSFLGQ